MIPKKENQKAEPLKRVLSTLANLGFTSTEAKVYVYLSKIGPQEGKILADKLKMSKLQLYSVLNNLKKKGAVHNKPERTTVFLALGFEELLNLYMRLGAEKAKGIKETKQELVDSWGKMIKNNSG